MARIKEGDIAPDFTLRANTGEDVTLSSFNGKKAVVLFFYPKDDTPGCTKEACDFRDSHVRFLDSGAEVIGVSSDSVDSHEKFAGKHNLPMKLLSDPGGTVRALYGVKATLGILPGRATFIIDRQGKVAYTFESQLRPHEHVKRALDVVKSLQAGA
jgi:peroxiredoxin Q/BCP